jgi:hypothetical protein
LYERRNGRWLTLDAYLDPEFGGVKGVIANRAELALANLKAIPQFPADMVEATARRVLLRMVNIAETGETTRQHVFKEEFFWSNDTTEQRKLVEVALNQLIQERLLNSDQTNIDTAVQRVVINLAHEVVIKAWPRLNSWVNTYKGDLLMRGRIESRAHAWKESGYQGDRLLRGSELNEALEWQKRRI